MNYLKSFYSGRLNRRTFLVGFIIYFVVYLVISLLFGGIAYSGSYGSGYSPISLIIMIILLVIFLSFLTKRWHDLGRSGWYSAIFLVIGALTIVPAIGFIASLAAFALLLYLFLAPGKAGSNMYGSQPGDALELGKLYSYK